MSVQDHADEVTRKVARQRTPGDTTDYIWQIGTTPENPLDIEGTISFSGLQIGFTTTTLIVGDTVTALPATVLPMRNSIVITNKSTTETLYIADNLLVTADSVVGTTSGHEIPPGEAFNVDLAGDVIIYGVAPTGKTILVKVTELA